MTISFNQGGYLRQCLDSVVSQKSADVEYIVVDPGSTDGSRQILESYGGLIDHLALEPDNGPADGLNRGFSLARGRVGYFINSDDFILPGGVGRMLRFWGRDPDADVLLGGAWMVDGRGRPIRELRAAPVSLSGLLSGSDRLVQQGMSFRLNRFRAAGGFAAANTTCWDYELLCMMLRGGARIAVRPDRFGAFRVHETSLSGGVGGEAHMRRYADDLDRIYLNITGRPPTPDHARAGLPRRVLRWAARPQHTLSHALDLALPFVMSRRWRSDTGRPPRGTTT